MASSCRTSAAPLLFVLLVVVVCLRQLSVGATERDCGTAVSRRSPPWPGVEWPDAFLAHTGRAGYSSLGCTLTFAHFVVAHSTWYSCYHSSSVHVVTCPERCLDALHRLRLPNATVYGSFPYHANSSICLAAVHAGVVSAEKGGGVFIDRHFPQDWSEVETQTLFPLGSAQGSWSFGVHSLDVPLSAQVTPAPLDSFSWTVRPRGVVPSQRQFAPFPPRSGHVHAWLYPQLQQMANWSTRAATGWETYRYNLHFVIGGHNASAYLNDVWVFHSLTRAPWNDTIVLDRHNSYNGRWYRLPDAPFTPRAHMAHHVIVFPDDVNFFRKNFNSPATRIIVLLYGGEVSHACGNRALGRCSNEVWQLEIRRSSDNSDPLVVPDLGLRFEWAWAASGNRSEAPLTLPFSPRCGFAPVFERRAYIDKQSRVTGIVGGQLSYEDDTCLAPIITVNEAYYGRWPYSQFHWTRGMDAPFSPRRSMVVDDAILSEDDQLLVYATLDKTVTLVGGIRYLSHRLDSNSTRSITTQAEVYADAWSCTVWPVWVEGSTRVDCDWRYSFPFANTLHGPEDEYAPSGSVPLPIAHSASALHPTGGYLINMRIGGATSKEALRAWSMTSLPAADLRGPSGLPLAQSKRWANVTLLSQPSGYRSRQLQNTGGSTLEEVKASRYRLPLAWTVDEAELNDPTSSLHLGSDEVVTHTMPYVWVQVKTQLTSVGDGRAPALPPSPLDGSSRSLFNFRLGRLDHSMASTWNTAIISGGRAGDVYFNDWITFEPSFCLWPEDPSYADELGPVQFVYRDDPDWSGHVFYLYYTANVSEPSEWQEAGSFHSGEEITAQCPPGWHFEPPLEEAHAKLTCGANSLWIDAQLGGVRRCVQNRQCPPPLVDEGYDECVEPAPEVFAIEVVTAQWTPLFVQHNRDPATVVDILPIYLDYTRANQLIVHGQWLTSPVSITVGARACYNPQVRNVSSHCWYPSADAEAEVCRDFGQSVMCTLVDDLGVSQKVIVVSGRGNRRRTISSLALSTGPRGATSLTLSPMEPYIVYLGPPRSASEPLCEQPNSLTLTDCPNTAVSRVQVCASGASLSGRYSAAPAFEATRTQSEPTVLADTTALTCDSWEYSFFDNQPCGLEIYWCDKVQICAFCMVEPILGRSLTLSIVYNITATESITNAKQNSLRSTAATMSFAGCPTGTFTNYSAHFSERCVACRPGESTIGLHEQQQCTPCKPGYHAPNAGSAECAPCEKGTYSSSSGQQFCEPCTGNSWQLFSGQSRCSKCEQGKYKVLGLPSLNSSTNISTLPCEACPTGAQCDEDGVITAGPGSFLILYPATGLVSSLDCLWTACVTDSPSCLQARQTAAWSGVSVSNCCGDNRKTAIDKDGVINPLCAECLDGYTEMQGQCVECRATRWDRLLGILALLFLLVYLLHRLSQRSPSAQLSIFFYSSQMSLLFLSSEPVPYVFALVNIDLLGNPSSSSTADLLPSACVLPVSDYGKIGVRLLSPVVALLLLGLLCLIQLACRAVVYRDGMSPSLALAYRLLFTSRASLKLPWTTGETLAGGSRALLELSAVVPALAKPLLDDDEKRFGDSDSFDVGNSIKGHLSASSTSSPDAGSLNSGSEEAVAATSTPAKEHWRSVLLLYETTAVRLTMFSYNVLATVCLAFFHTRFVDGFGRRLWSYPAIETSSGAYVGLIPLIGSLLVLAVFGGPVALLAYLVWLRRAKRIGGEVTAPQGGNDVDVLQAGISATVLPAALMTATFRPRYWFMSVVQMSRRLALIVCLTFAGQPQAYTFLTLLNCAFVVLHSLMWPYRLEKDNWLEIFALFILVIQTTLLSLYPAFQSRSPVASFTLWVLLFLPGALMLLLSLVDALRYVQHRRSQRQQT